MSTDADKIAAALEIANDFAGDDGSHHKAYCIDQMVRALTGCPPVEMTALDCRQQPYTYEAMGESAEYEAFVAPFCGRRRVRMGSGYRAMSDGELVSFIKARIAEANERPEVMEFYAQQLADGYRVLEKLPGVGVTDIREIYAGPWKNLVNQWRDHPDFQPEWDNRMPYERDDEGGETP